MKRFPKTNGYRIAHISTNKHQHLQEVKELICKFHYTNTKLYNTVANNCQETLFPYVFINHSKMCIYVGFDKILHVVINL